MVNNLIVCGGTFDYFHKGHESLLKLAFSLGRKVIVGVTSDAYVQKSKFAHSASSEQNSELIKPFEKRKQSVLKFIRKEKVLDKAEIIKIDDLFGPTLSKDLLINAIAVSDDTKKGADIINQKRKELGLNLLKILIVSPVKAEDGRLITSQRIRNGEISRVGELYIKPAWLKTDLFLPEYLKEEFKKPFGALSFDVLKHQNQFPWVVSVGDVATKKFNELAVNQKISVIDFKVARKEAFSSFSDLGFSGDEKVIIAENPASHITCDLFSKILDIFKSDFEKRVILKIAGEEDLAVLPLVLAAPLGAIIYYGQPDTGLVKVLVSEDSKNKAYNLVSKLKPV